MDTGLERSTTEDRVIAYLIEWLCELTGKPVSEFEHKTSYELYEILTEINPDVTLRPRRRKGNENDVENQAKDKTEN